MKAKKRKIIGLLACLAILVLLCSRCGDADNGQDESPLAVPTTSEPQFESPIVPTATPWPSCLTLIEPVGNTVCGYIVSSSHGVPIAGRPVFLARARFTSDNSAVFAELKREVAPRAILDENGMFYMVDVQSDLYFLMMDDYPQPVMLKERDNPMNDLIVDWRESGGAVDLGIITSYVYITPEP